MISRSPRASPRSQRSTAFEADAVVVVSVSNGIVIEVANLIKAFHLTKRFVPLDNSTPPNYMYTASVYRGQKRLVNRCVIRLNRRLQVSASFNSFVTVTMR